MTGRPSFVPRNTAQTDIDPSKRTFAAEQSDKKRDNDPRSKDSYEPSDKRGAGNEHEFPVNDSGPSDEEPVAGDRDKRGAA
jgi:hypothetical protein